MNSFMEKLEGILNKYLMPVADNLNKNKIMTAIKDGMMCSLPVTLIASVALILSNFPFLSNYAPGIDAVLKKIFSSINPVTLGLLAIYIIIGTARSYSKNKNIDPMYGIMCALASFLLVTPFSTVTDVIVDGEVIKNATVSNIIPTNVLGASGVFPALIITFISISVLAYLEHKKFTIKMPDSVPDNIAKPFLAIIPIGGAILVALAIRLVFEITPFGTLQNCIDTVITKPFLSLGNNIWVFLFIIFVCQVLWFFGIHGTNLVLNTVWQPIALVAMAANLEAFSAGQPLPYVLTAAFTCFTGQAKLSEIVALSVLGKSKQAKAISKLSLVPALFNIHEPFVFGLPVIMNTTLVIPWMIVESLQAGLAYFLVVLTGTVPIFQAPWTCPPIIQQLIATNFNPWSVVITIATFALGFVLWVPFIKLLDKQYLENEK
ncbi:PTS sugar transporter subunit IIC [Clostridium neonatale]|uniref:PTS sugar transporter subunit IIC n=1 Tax=Clostridium neonatale TaxID=137838 RepID=UPI00291B873F|nr:Permease IIC component [Clostridium neonatale]CAI3554956.1 Permease IIC component [Clostridium neonatale]CAI3562835.1 Permease IIC component [Clostridium neonatale]CAI3657315.1 Permease IIC component [Clostridium neonatale]CAI3678599.1 Permease IIC component [Clostridium neonatale]